MLLLLLLREGEEWRREGEPGRGAGPLMEVSAERGPEVLMLSLREKLG